MPTRFSSLHQARSRQVKKSSYCSALRERSGARFGMRLGGRFRGL